MTPNTSPSPASQTATERHARSVLHTQDTGSSTTARLPKDSRLDKYCKTPEDHPASISRSTNDTKGDHRKPSVTSLVRRQRGHTSYQDITMLPFSFPSVRPTTLPQFPRFPPHAHGMNGNTSRLYMPYNGPYNVATLRTPVEAAAHRQISKLLTGVSVHYQGDPFLKANQSANIPDELNTSVWITNLPPDVNHKKLLDNVRNCGKIYAAVINGPENGHITAASKIVFFDVAGADNLLQQAREGRFVVGGYMPRVRRNRIKTEAKPPSPSSRVLHIEGPSCLVNEVYLRKLFSEDSIVWQDEVVVVLSSNEMLTRLEWRFGSYRCQAESARHLIERIKRRNSIMSYPEDSQLWSWLWQGVTVHFGVDPCAPAPGKYFSYPSRFPKMLHKT
ncbi:hypothetical protein NUW58_g570 [Xylaria curta]|uniref:Uncharacterized protein n=1 Tax=Xylaria curta TaxID=42375 RepID=A0ACC1PS48_9PEZI|nr:hypothetical protein NUW58_g570 [Xylaria curta]